MNGALGQPLNRLCAILSLTALVACSGGGTPDTGNGVSVSPASLSFTTARLGAATAQTLAIAVTAPDAHHVVVGHPPGASTPAWLTLVLDDAATPPTVAVTATPGLLAAGSRQAVVRVSIVRADLSVIGYVDVPVSFTITPFAPEATPPSLSFTQPVGGAAPAAQTVALEALGDSYAWTATVEYAGATGWLRLNGGTSASGSALPASLGVSIAGASGLAEGTHAAEVRVSGPGGALAIPVSLVVRPATLSLPAAFYPYFDAVAGQATLPAAVAVNVGAEAGSIPFTTTVTYGAGASGWLDVPASGTAPVTLGARPNTTMLQGATYDATVTFTPGNGTPARTLSFRYYVRPAELWANPNALEFRVSPATVAAELTQALTLTSGSGIPLEWTAATSHPWLTVSPASGTSGTTVSVSVDPAAIDAMKTVARATLSFAYSGAVVAPGAVKTVTVYFSSSIPAVSLVTPAVAYEGEARPVLVRGAFDGTSSYALTFGASEPVAASNLAPYLVRVTPPVTLAPGRHRVRLAENPNALGVNPSSAELLVLPSTAHTPGLIASPGARKRLLYDAERRCLYAADTAAGAVQRFCDGASGWVADSLALTGVVDIAMTAAGRQIVAITGGALHRIDAASFTLVASFDAGSIGMGATMRAVAVTYADQVLALGGYWEDKDLWAWNLGSENPAWKVTGSAVEATDEATNLAASLDGSRVVTGDSYWSAPTPRRFVSYDAPKYQATASAAAAAEVSRVALDRTGARIVAWGRVYDGAYASLGSLGTPAATVAPDGDRAYSVEWAWAGANPVVHTWDVTGTSAAELGAGVTVTPDPGLSYPNLLLVSLDGRTLFVDGTSGILVVPLP